MSKAESHFFTNPLESANSATRGDVPLEAWCPLEKLRLNKARQLRRDLESMLYRLLKHRSSTHDHRLIESVCSSVPFDSLDEDQRTEAVNTVLSKVSKRS